MVIDADSNMMIAVSDDMMRKTHLSCKVSHDEESFILETVVDSFRGSSSA